MDDAPQLMAVCQLKDDSEAADGYLIEEVIQMYDRWAGHRCLMDKINHPRSKFNISMAIKLDRDALLSLPKDRRYIIRFRTKQFSRLKAKKIRSIKYNL